MKYVTYAAIVLNIFLCVFLKQSGEAFAWFVALMFSIAYFTMKDERYEIPTDTVEKILEDYIKSRKP